MNGIFEYLCSGIDAAARFYESLLIKNVDFLLKESIFVAYANLVLLHQDLALNTAGYKKSQLPSLLMRGVELYPENTLLLSMFVKSQNHPRIENRVALTLDKICKKYLAL